MSADLSGEAVILSLPDGVYYGLDPVGAKIWALLQEPRTLGEVADALVAEYDVERERALEDLYRLTAQLLERGLLSLADGATR